MTRIHDGTATKASDDGSVLVGWSYAPEQDSGSQATFWDRTGRCRPLKSYLQGLGLTVLDNWQLAWADDVSADGHSIIGVGRNPAGNYEYWIARIGPLCPGDVNADQVADLSDLVLVLAHFGNTADAVRIEGDLDDDGAVGIGDLAQLLQAFGNGCDR